MNFNFPKRDHFPENQTFRKYFVSAYRHYYFTSLSRSVTVAEWLRAHAKQDRTAPYSVGSNPAGSPFCSELGFDVDSIPDSFNIFFPYTLFSIITIFKYSRFNK